MAEVPTRIIILVAAVTAFITTILLNLIFG
jgi:hypothetical protein